VPVTQLTDQGGLGTLVGLAGGYLLGNPERKAKKAQQDIENKRNAANDARATARDQDYHDEITANIKKGQAETQHTADTDVYNRAQNGAYATLSAQLQNRPEGVTAQQWVAHVQQQTPSLGLTDPTLLGKLYTQAQGVLTKDQADNAASFVSHEHALPSDPQQRLSTLMKRLQIERGVPGVDTKPTETMIADLQKQITEAQVAAHQAAIESERTRHDRATEGNAAQRIVISQGRGSAAAGDPQAFADVTGRLRKAKTRDEAQAVLDSPEGSLLGEHQYDRLQKQVDSTFGTHSQANPRAPKKTSEELRDADFRQAKQVYDQPNSDKNAIVNAFAAKWKMTPQAAKAYFK
jgi:hypothetical protein